MALRSLFGQHIEPNAFEGFVFIQPIKENPNIRDVFGKKLGGAKGKTKARLANRGWFDDLTHI